MGLIMKKITKISTQQNKGRYNLFVEEKFLCGISEETLIQFDLKKGMLIDDETLFRIEECEKKNQCFDAALKLLGRQNYFTKILKHKLRQKGYSEEAIDYSISKLQEMGYVNDDSLVASYIKDKKRFSQKGSVYISQMLWSKGLAPNQINQALEEYYSFEEETENCRAVAIKKLESYKKKETDPYKLKGKLYSFLMQRGFKSAVIETVINDLFTR